MKKLIITLSFIFALVFTLNACSEANGQYENDMSQETDAVEKIDVSEEDSDESEGETFKITFKQEGCEDVVRKVISGEDLSDVPTPISRAGYTAVWDRTDFTDITEDLTVNAIETPKTYTLVLNPNGGEVSPTEISVTYGEGYELPEPTYGYFNFGSWQFNGENISLSGIWNIDAEDSEIEIVAKWDWSIFI